MAVLLMTVENLKKKSFIDTNVEDKTIKLSMELAQDQILEPILGSVLWEKITDGIFNGNLALDYQNLVTQYLWPTLVNATEVIAYKKILYRITNDAVVKSSNANSTAIDIGELRTLIKDNEIFMRQYIERLQRYLNANTTKFPEYNQVDSDSIPAEQIQSGLDFYFDLNWPGNSNYGPSSRDNF